MSNALWSWLGILFGLISALFLSPYVIHRLGEVGYGIWALVFTFVDYYVIVDFGFRSSILKYASHYRATGEIDRLEELLSTAFVYFSIAAAVVVLAALAVSTVVTRFFHVPPAEEPALRFLTVTVGIGAALGIVFNTASAVLEAHQRFDITSSVQIAVNGIRTIGCFAVMFMGWGLKGMGLCVLGSQLIGHVLTLLALRRLTMGMTFSLDKARVATLRRMAGYGLRTFVANASLNVLNQNAPLLIGHFLSATFVGYYTYAQRLLTLPVQFVDRLTTLTGSKTAELTAHGNMDAIYRLAVLVNRYCLILFFPVPVYLTIFGRQLLEVWISPAFAANSAPLLPVLGVGILVASAAQLNSSAILYGLARHGSMARALFLEAVLSGCCLWYAVPRYGLFVAACIVSGLMIGSRGLYISYSVCRALNHSYSAYQWEIYFRPAVTMIPVAVVAWFVNRAIGEPATWPVVLAGGAGIVSCYYALSFSALAPEHRMRLRSLAASRLRACLAALTPNRAV